jgi:hypothetical protein
MQVKALNDRDPLNLSALQLSQPPPKKESSSFSIDWDNFDIDQIPEDLIMKVENLDKEVPSSKFDDY